MRRSILFLALLVLFVLLLVGASSTVIAQATLLTKTARPSRTPTMTRTATPTQTPTLSPDLFNAQLATTVSSADKVISINLPDGWRSDTPNGGSNSAGQYSWYIGPSKEDAIVDIEFQLADKIKFYQQMSSGQPAPKTIKEALAAFIKSVGTSEPKLKIGPIKPVTVGGYEGFGFTAQGNTYSQKVVSTIDLRLVEVPGDWILLVGYAAHNDILPKAKPVLDAALKSVEVNIDHMPTLTPTAPTIPDVATEQAAVVPTELPATSESKDNYSTDYRMIPQSTTVDGAPILGNASAKVTLLLFIDYSCPHCAEYESTIHRVISEYVRTGKMRLIVRLETFVGNDYSHLAAEAALCAGQQKHFWEMNDALFEIQQQEGYTGFTLQTIDEIAQSLELNKAKFDKCMSSNDAEKTLTTSAALGEKLGLTGVPAVFYSLDGTTFKWFRDKGEQEIHGGISFTLISDLIKK